MSVGSFDSTFFLVFSFFSVSVTVCLQEVSRSFLCRLKLSHSFVELMAFGLLEMSLLISCVSFFSFEAFHIAFLNLRFSFSGDVAFREGLYCFTKLKLLSPGSVLSILFVLNSVQMGACRLLQMYDLSSSLLVSIPTLVVADAVKGEVRT